MNDDALPAIWTSDSPVNQEALMSAMNAVIDEDRAGRDKDFRIRIASVLVLAVLLPVLVWAAAYGISPLVRGGYGLMAVGTALLVATEWMYVTWSREALPGPADARSQLQKSAFLLARQASLMRMAPLWIAPVVIGIGLIARWLHEQRSASWGYLLFAALIAGWIAASIGGRSTGKKLDERRRRMERLLADLA